MRKPLQSRYVPWIWQEPDGNWGRSHGWTEVFSFAMWWEYLPKRRGHCPRDESLAWSISDIEISRIANVSKKARNT